ncbi:MAG: hypothetical protein CFH36_02399 [Alphaproteobacteria bacterium MarineAlpha9_Bin6]|nr:MAG: hypothetical protein CFH36_02399 [Alphaproteobacteria bacterium MarineAlpha9_Bin6]
MVFMQGATSLIETVFSKKVLTYLDTLVCFYYKATARNDFGPR